MIQFQDWERLCFPANTSRTGSPPICLNKTDRVALYGAGYGGLMFLELLRARGIEPECFLDRSPKKQGRTILGIPVWYPDRTVAAGATVIVCLLDMGGAFQQIRAQMKELGCRAVYHMYELREDRALFQGQPVIISPNRNLLWENRGSLYLVAQMLEDELSRRTLTSILRFLWSNLGEQIPALPMEDQYFARDVYSLDEHEIFVDCGAHVGEILNQFLRRCQERFDRYWAFEPDSQNVCALEQSCPPEYRGKLTVCRTALGDGPGTVQVRNYDGSNSVIREDGEEESPLAALDSFAENLHPTILKIDVEGWESRLLIGAENVIRRDKPVIAIAVYHRERDFWEIPLRLKELIPEYRFYLRSYLNVAETVLYAVPPERLNRKEHEV